MVSNLARHLCPIVVVLVSSPQQMTAERQHGDVRIAPARCESDAEREPKQLDRERHDTPADKLLNRLDELNRTLTDEMAGGDEWAVVLRDLIQLGPDAVPALTAKMDGTSDEWMLRSLCFVMRGIGDKRVVPAIIRALPKTCSGFGSDNALALKDPELLAFMRKHNAHDSGDDKLYFLGRAITEFSVTLQNLTGMKHGEDEIWGVIPEGNTRQQFLARSLYQRCAERWAAWWESHWNEQISDGQYSRVNLAPLVDEQRLTNVLPVGPQISMTVRHSNHILESVRNPKAKQVFLDLDTGRTGGLPEYLRVAERQPERVDDILAWAAREGYDLMGTEYTAPGSDKPQYVLRGLGLSLWEIETDHWKEMQTRNTSREPLTMGTRTDGLLARFDMSSGQYAPEETATFLFQTREQGYGMIFIGVQVHNDRLTPGTYSGRDTELSPIAFCKGRRFAYGLIADRPVDR